MIRRIEIEIDSSSWVASSVPSSFIGVTSFDVDVIEFLLLLGFITTPIVTTGFSLSEFWAQFRYIPAITDDPDLRISDLYSELDAHQKMILSDDFGMGITMNWLHHNLGIVDICDGYRFRKTYSNLIVAPKFTIKKRGPQKTPDFIALDNNGKLHVIECKGTQSGEQFLNRQLQSAISQKGSLIIKAPFKGESLACGVSIANSGSSYQTKLKVVDPINNETKTIIDEKGIGIAKKIMFYSNACRAFNQIGMYKLSQFLWSSLNLSAENKIKTEYLTLDNLKEIIDEIAKYLRLSQSLSFSDDFVGKRQIIRFQKDSKSREGSFNEIHLETGASVKLLMQLLIVVERVSHYKEFNFSEIDSLITQSFGRTKLKNKSLEIGNSYIQSASIIYN